jgi:hypothetical protein
MTPQFHIYAEVLPSEVICRLPFTEDAKPALSEAEWVSVFSVPSPLTGEGRACPESVEGVRVKRPSSSQAPNSQTSTTR